METSPHKKAFGEGLMPAEADAHIRKLVENAYATVTADYNDYGKKGRDDSVDLATRIDTFHRAYDTQFQDIIEALNHVNAETVKTGNGSYWSIDPKRDIREIENLRDLEVRLPPRRGKEPGDEEYRPIPSVETHMPDVLGTIMKELSLGKEKLIASESTGRKANKAVMEIDKGLEAARAMYEDFQYGNYYTDLHKAVQAGRERDKPKANWEGRTAGSIQAFEKAR